jgi:hypothetical protein
MYHKLMHYMRDVNCPDGLKRFTGLMATSAFLGGNAFLRNGPIKRLYPNLFVIVIAHPGNGKSLMSDTIMDIVHLYMEKYGDLPGMDLNYSANTSNPAAFVELMSKAPFPKPITVDSKEETVTQCLLPASELAVLIENSKFGSMLTDLLEYYDCRKEFRKHTRTKGMEIIHRPVPSLIGSTTPQFWNQFMPSSLARDGFSSRCLLYHFNEFIWRDGDIRWGSYSDLLLCVEEGFRLRNLVGEFTFTPEAFTWLTSDFNEANNQLMFQHFGKSDLWQGYTNRRMDQLKKIGMCLSASEGNSLKIELHHLKGALAHLEIIEKGLPGLINRKDIRFDTRLSTLLDEVIGEVPMSLNEIVGALLAKNVHPKLTDITSLIETLMVGGMLFKDAHDKYRRLK